MFEGHEENKHDEYLSDSPREKLGINDIKHSPRKQRIQNQKLLHPGSSDYQKLKDYSSGPRIKTFRDDDAKSPRQFLDSLGKNEMLKSQTDEKRYFAMKDKIH